MSIIGIHEIFVFGLCNGVGGGCLVRQLHLRDVFFRGIHLRTIELDGLCFVGRKRTQRAIYFTINALMYPYRKLRERNPRRCSGDSAIRNVIQKVSTSIRPGTDWHPSSKLIVSKDLEPHRILSTARSGPSLIRGLISMIHRGSLRPHGVKNISSGDRLHAYMGPDRLGDAKVWGEYPSSG